MSLPELHIVKFYTLLQIDPLFPDPLQIQTSLNKTDLQYYFIQEEKEYLVLR